MSHTCMKKVTEKVKPIILYSKFFTLLPLTMMPLITVNFKIKMIKDVQ